MFPLKFGMLEHPMNIEQGGGTQRTTAQKLAFASFWIPFGTCIVVIPALAVLSKVGGTSLIPIRLAVLGIGCLGLLIGFILGSFSLIMACRQRCLGLLTRSLFGVICNGGLLALVGLATHSLAKENGSSWKFPRTAKSRHSAALDPESLRKDIQIFRNAAKKEQGDSQIMDESLARILTRFLDCVDNLKRAAMPLENHKLLNMSGVDIIQLKYREAILNRFSEANDQVEESLNQMPQAYEKELTLNGISTTAARARRKGLVDQLAQSESDMAILDLNRDWVHDELKALRILETNWGQWHYDLPIKKIIFADQSTAENFNDLVRQVNRLAAQRKRLQSEFLMENQQ